MSWKKFRCLNYSQAIFKHRPGGSLTWYILYCVWEQLREVSRMVYTHFWIELRLHRDQQSTWANGLPASLWPNTAKQETRLRCCLRLCEAHGLHEGTTNGLDDESRFLSSFTLYYSHATYQGITVWNSNYVEAASCIPKGSLMKHVFFIKNLHVLYGLSCDSTDVHHTG